MTVIFPVWKINTFPVFLTFSIKNIDVAPK